MSKCYNFFRNFYCVKPPSPTRSTLAVSKSTVRWRKITKRIKRELVWIAHGGRSGLGEARRGIVRGGAQTEAAVHGINVAAVARTRVKGQARRKGSCKSERRSQWPWPLPLPLPLPLALAFQVNSLLVWAKANRKQLLTDVCPQYVLWLHVIYCTHSICDSWMRVFVPFSDLIVNWTQAKLPISKCLGGKKRKKRTKTRCLLQERWPYQLPPQQRWTLLHNRVSYMKKSKPFCWQQMAFWSLFVTPLGVNFDFGCF